MSKQKSAINQPVKPGPAALILCGLFVFLLVHWIFGVLMVSGGIVWQVAEVGDEQTN